MKNKLSNYQLTIFFLLLVSLLSILIGFPVDSYAATSTSPTCSDLGAMSKTAGKFSENIFKMIEVVIIELNKKLITNMYLLYEMTIVNLGYRSAVWAAIILMVSFYGILFMFGIVPATFAQALVRLIKIGFIAWLIDPAGPGIYLFGTIFVQFFYIGVQCLILDVVTIGVVDIEFISNISTNKEEIRDALVAAQLVCKGGSFLPSDMGVAFQQIFSNKVVAAPLLIFKDVMGMMFSPRIFVIAFATFTTGPYGPIMGMAFLWSIWQLLQAIIRGLQVYVLSLVVRAILLALAPIFVPFILFERTKHLFMGWINQLVSFSLQPVMLFAFLSFFSMIITDASDDMLKDKKGRKVEVCYTKTSSVGELPFDIQKWSFKVDDKMYEGEWTTKGCMMEKGASADACKEPFPIEIVDILIFLLLTYVAVQMVDVVVGVAAQISQGSLRLTGMVNNTNSWFTGQQGGGSNTASSQYARRVARSRT